MKKLSEQMVTLAWICIFALIGITAVLNNADKIDAWFAPDEVWSGVVNQHDWVATDGQVVFYTLIELKYYERQDN